MTTRRYDNSARRAQQEATREAIIRAMVSAMAEGNDDVAVKDIAVAAGVSTRTVYVHFPDRASRVEGINAWIEGQVDMSQVLPATFSDLPGYGSRLVDYVFDNEEIIRAQMAPGLSRAVRTLRKRPHIRAVSAILVAEGWPAVEAKQLATLLVAAVRAEVIFDLRDTYGYPKTQIRKMMQRLVGSLLDRSAWITPALD